MDNSSKTDWESLQNLPDEQIDYSDIPELDDDFFEHSTLHIPAAQARSFIKLDPDVSTWFRAQGPQYQALVNTVLRNHISGH